MKDDVISRQAALQAMDTWDKFGCGPDGKLVRCDDDSHYVPYVHYDDMVHAIEHLPSAEPEKVLIAKIILSEEQIREAIERAKNEIVQVLQSTKPEQPPEIQDILDYLDTVLHPIISPEHWDVYSELHDMISSLPSTQPETYKEKLKEIADALSEKFAYMDTCPNERDIILGYLGVERPSKIHCNTDCTHIKCESYHFDKTLPSAQPKVSRIEQELHGKTPEEQYEFLYWLLLKFGLAYTDSRLAVIEWLRGEKEDE